MTDSVPTGRYSHLDPRTAALLDLSDDQRIAEIQSDKWINYSAASNVIARLEGLMNYPRVVRPPSLLVIGESNQGKSALIQRFMSDHPAYDNPDGENVVVPVIRINAGHPDPALFFQSILKQIFADYRQSDSWKALQERVGELLPRLGVRLLIIDDINNYISGPYNQQKKLMVALRKTSGDLHLPIAGFGMQDAKSAVATDVQLDNRFRKLELPRWTYGEEWRRLLKTFEMMLPLHEPSKLAGKSMAKKLHGMTGGVLGDLWSLLNAAAVHAVQTGTERIDDAGLNAARDEF